MEENEKEIAGFSKLTKRDKIYWLAKNFLYANPVEVLEFAEYWHDNIEAQKLLDGLAKTHSPIFLFLLALPRILRLMNRCMPYRW